MRLDLVDKITKDQIRNDVPTFKPGDTLKVYVRIREGEKSRIQMFEGVCVSKKNGGIGETFTVRKISGGIGVQRTFPVNSPIIDHIEVTRRGKVRRALRTLVSRKIVDKRSSKALHWRAFPLA